MSQTNQKILTQRLKQLLQRVDSKTSVQSTTGPDNLPTNIVDIKADEDHIKGVEIRPFLLNFNNSSNDDVDPENQEPLFLINDLEAGNKMNHQIHLIHKWE